MKDWKFVAEHPTYEAYTTPIFFSDDWLNGPTGMGHAYKFCYLGPKGTTTPLHADVLNSYSWSTNICGRKRWHMVPSEYTHLLYDVFGRRLAAHMNADHDDYIGNDFGTCLYPGLAEARRSIVSRARFGSGVLPVGVLGSLTFPKRVERSSTITATNKILPQLDTQKAKSNLMIWRST